MIEKLKEWIMIAVGTPLMWIGESEKRVRIAKYILAGLAGLISGLIIGLKL